MADLAHFATSISYKPVLDRTELGGTYDLVVEWDASAGTEAAHQAFRDLGFRLVDGEAPVAASSANRADAGPEVATRRLSAVIWKSRLT